MRLPDTLQRFVTARVAATLARLRRLIREVATVNPFDRRVAGTAHLLAIVPATRRGRAGSR